MADYGNLSPRALRSSIRYYGYFVDQMAYAWRMRHGLPVEVATISAFGEAREGVRRSAF